MVDIDVKVVDLLDAAGIQKPICVSWWRKVGKEKPCYNGGFGNDYGSWIGITLLSLELNQVFRMLMDDGRVIGGRWELFKVLFVVLIGIIG